MRPQRPGTGSGPRTQTGTWSQVGCMCCSALLGGTLPLLDTSSHADSHSHYSYKLYTLLSFPQLPWACQLTQPQAGLAGLPGTLGYSLTPTRALLGVSLCPLSCKHQARLKTSILRSRKLVWDPIIFLLGTQLSGWGMIFCQSSSRCAWISLLLTG